MIDPKVLFVKQFLAALFNKNVITIPINDEKFKQGLTNMEQYFKKNYEEFGPYAKKLEILFLKYSTRGDYREFSKIIESFNGRVVSLENPHYIKANIRLEKKYAADLVRNQELNIQNQKFEDLVNCFRRGAGV